MVQTLLEKLLVPQLVKKFAAFCAMLRFITVFKVFYRNLKMNNLPGSCLV
jgi:hypothetical protein